MRGEKWCRALCISSIIGAALLTARWSWAQTPASDRKTDALRVGAVGSEPFVMEANGTLHGLSVAVWHEVAAKAGVTFTISRQPSVTEALASLVAGDVDVVVGPVSITAERAGSVQFTQPYFQAKLSILAPSSSSFSRLTPMLSRAFVAGVGLLMLVLLVVGTLLWLAERKQNPEQFPEQPIAGIGNGIWLALVTMTTVGYGDRAPVSKLGRLVAGVWMVIALISASSLTAGIATGLTLSHLEGATISRLGELDDRRVAVVTGTTGEALATAHRARLIQTSTLTEAITRVQNEEADAVVFDRPMLEYYVKQHPTTDLEISDDAWEPQGYGFALRLSDGHVPALNVALLELAETGAIREIVREWLGSSGSDGG